MVYRVNDRLIDEYLLTLGDQLRRCSRDWRDEQLKEIAQHIQSIVADQLSAGVSQNDAVRTALEQVGDPISIGKNLYEQWTKDTVRRFCYKTSKYGARTLSVLLTTMLAVFAIGEGVSPSRFSHAEAVLSLFMIAIVAGGLIGWKSEKVGGIVSLTGIAGFYAADYAASGNLPRFSMLILSLLVLPGVLFLVSATFAPKRKTIV